MNKCDSVQLVLQLSDKGVFETKKELYNLLGINSDTKELDGSWDEINDTDKTQILMQLYDRNLLQKHILKKEIIPLLEVK